jgi:hypothetical protein
MMGTSLSLHIKSSRCSLVLSIGYHTASIADHAEITTGYQSIDCVLPSPSMSLHAAARLVILMLASRATACSAYTLLHNAMCRTKVCGKKE